MELYLFAPFCLVVFALGVSGYRTAPLASSCHTATVGAAMLRTIMLVARSGGGCAPADIPVPVPLLIAQFLLPLILVLGTVVTAVKIVLVNLRHDTQIALARTLHGHTIICGLAETGMEAVRQLVLQHGDVIAIALDPKSEGARICESLGVPLIIGDATLPKTLGATGIKRARAVMMCTGDDALNLEICLVINAMQRRAGKELLLFPEVRGAWIFDILEQRTTPIIGAGLQLHPFRASESIARKLLSNPVFFAAAPSPKLLFLGFGDLSQAILRRAVLSNYALPGVRVKAVCADAAAAPEQDAETPDWWKFLDVEFVSHAFGTQDVADATCLRGILQKFRPDIVVIALGHDEAALRLASVARGMLDGLTWFDTAIFVHVENQTLLGGLLGGMADLPLCRYRFAGFGDLGEVMAPNSLFDEQLDNIARNVHEIYLANSEGASPARLPWEQLPERYRLSSRAAADHIPVKLGHVWLMMEKGSEPAAEISIREIELMAAAEHYRWSLNMRAAGWRQALQRSDVMKTHPLLVGWEELPEAVRQDNLKQAASIIPILARAGFTVKRIVKVLPGGEASCGPTEMPCYEIDPASATDYTPAEAWLQAHAARAIIRRGAVQRAEDFQKFAAIYPTLAQSVMRWQPVADGIVA